MAKSKEKANICQGFRYLFLLYLSFDITYPFELQNISVANEMSFGATLFRSIPAAMRIIAAAMITLRDALSET
jgi:hypothetical protein